MTQRILIYLAEIQYYDNSPKTLFVGTHGFITEPTDTPANTFFHPLIEQPSLYTMNAWSTDGQSSKSGSGELRLINTNGDLDFLADCSLDGRVFKLMCAYENDSYTTFQANTLMSGTMLVPSWEDGIVVIKLRDKQAIFDRPLQISKYAGGNVLPNGIEGNDDDLKDQYKPYLLGTAFNFSPPCNNTSLLIYQVSSDAIHAVSEVYDRGAALAQGADYSSQNDMQTNAPLAGYYRVWPGGGCFRLGAQPSGQITCTASDKNNLSDRYPGQLIKRAALKAGLTSNEINATDVIDLDTNAPYECGIWVYGDDTVSNVIDAIAVGAGAWWTFDANGVLRMGQLKAPTGTPVATLTSAEIIENHGIERISTGDGPDGLPPKEITIHYARNYTLQPSDIAGVVAQQRREWLNREWRSVKKTSNTISNKYLLAGVLERYTPICHVADAQTESQRIRTLRCTRRDTVRVYVQVSPDIQASLSIGAVVSLQYPRHGYDSGRLMIVTGIEHDARIGLFGLTLWG